MDHTDPSALDRRLLLGAAGLAGLAALASGRAHAGPLTPPGGAVAGTGRTLDEIYNRIGADGRIPIPGGTTAFSITAPGAYVLTGNLTSSGNPIQINATGVDLDLNGFTVTGTPDITAIQFVGAGRNVRIHNGCIREGYYGVNATGTVACVLEDLRIERCRYAGIRGAGVRGNLYRRCLITDTGALTTTADGGLAIRGIEVAGIGTAAIECAVHKVSSAGTTPVFRGIDVSGSNNLIARCLITGETAISGNGVSITGTAVYRDNTVMGFTTAYSGGTNGLGNV